MPDEAPPDQPATDVHLRRVYPGGLWSVELRRMGERLTLGTWPAEVRTPAWALARNVSMLLGIPLTEEEPGLTSGPDRCDFIRRNAVALVEQLEAKVARQREELAKLNQRREHLTAERDRLREALRAIWRRAAEGGPGLTAYMIEADARQALAASGITVDA